MSNNKENLQEEPGLGPEEAASELQSVASPKVSGSQASGDPHRAPSYSEGGGYELSVGHDHLHWAGVGQRQPHDARSVASSAAAERDDKSIYEDPGPLDATEEGEEHDDDDDEEPEEIALTQVQDGLQPVQLRSEGSNVESTFTAISGAASLADVADQLADQAVAGELSPRQASAAIRSAAQQASAAAAAAADRDGEEEAGAGGSTVGAEAEGSESASAPARSVAPSEEGWQGGGSSTADLGGMESISLDGEVAAAAGVAAQQVAAEQQQAAPVAAGAAVDPVTNPFAAEPSSAAAAEAPAAAAAGTGAGDAAEQVETNPFLASDSGNTGSAEVPAGTSLAEAAAGGAGMHRAGASYQSRLMQQLTASTSEDDITVYSTDAAGVPQEAVPPPVPTSTGQQAGGSGSGLGAAGAAGPSGLHPLSVENGSADGATGVMPAEATAAALAAINIAGGSTPPQPAGSSAPPVHPSLLFPPQWYQTFKGLLYMDGVDALGRPVVVLNADAVPANMKSSALVFVKAHLEPLVNQGDYVLVFTSRGATKLPSMWVMGAYRSLPRPFRKNVQHIVLVRPSAFLRAVLAFMRPFVSKKAGRKIKQVQSVQEIAEATGGEVTLQSLGPAFAAEQLAAVQAAGSGSGADHSP